MGDDEDLNVIARSILLWILHLKFSFCIKVMYTYRHDFRMSTYP